MSELTNDFVTQNDLDKEYVVENTELEWGAVILLSFQKLAKLNLGTTAYKILFYFMSKVDGNTNKITIKQSELRYELNLQDPNSDNLIKYHKTTISKAIQELIENNILKRNNKTYFINPDIFYIGGPKKRKEYLREYNKEER
ncbi:hypothetical protein BUZ78_12310 [Staphylococcus saprophyticus]|uniref:replication/maintenance protein RepL n=1 Tax=Staphylococcus saprophyticus TaxID=29385 RepID=UPI000D1F3C72|nr:replication/maintenance protein RepL [Staphylococcus saprophyticus]PTK14174.1 hypothetical protein BUZ78_12310 [Staphylococcus saprophyticus]